MKRGEGVPGTMGTQGSRNQPELPVGKRLKESFLEEVMPELTLERGVEADRAEQRLSRQG